MVRVGRKMQWTLAVVTLFGCLARTPAQDTASPLVASGQTTIGGQSRSYLIRHLPVSSFPQLPPAIQHELNRRGCLIPQTYEARRPENVVHASFEHPGSSDWAVLCSVDGSVSLLVFFDGNGDPAILASAMETSRLQSRGASGMLGFNWAIDPASPQTVHEAQLGMRHPPPRLDHDALADSVIDQRTVYRFYVHNAWTILDTQD